MARLGGMEAEEFAEQAGAHPLDGVGEPDSLQRLWNPHRMAYILGENKPTGPKAEDGCPFCRIPGLGDDEAALIVARGESVYAVLNLYPYNPGHVLVCPYRHIADYTELTVDEAAEFTVFTQDAMRAVRKASSPEGFNLGINQGDVAGAGIAGHLHQHIVPRWSGDSNFMPVVGRTRSMPVLLGETRRLLAEAWPTSSVG